MRKKAGVVVPFRSDTRKLEGVIRRIAQETLRVAFTEHALERMDERSITDLDVYRTLRSGYVEPESIKPGKCPNEQICKVLKPIKGARDLGVVTVVIRSEELVIITVEWEDLP